MMNNCHYTIIKNFDSYCKKLNLTVVYYHHSGFTQNVDEYIAALKLASMVKAWKGLAVVEDIEINLYPPDFESTGWEDLKLKIDTAVITKTFTGVK